MVKQTKIFYMFFGRPFHSLDSMDSPQQIWRPHQSQVTRVHVGLGAQCAQVGQVFGQVLQSPEVWRRDIKN